MHCRPRCRAPSRALPTCRRDAMMREAALLTRPSDSLSVSSSTFPMIFAMDRLVCRVIRVDAVSRWTSSSCCAVCFILEASNVQESATSVSSIAAGTEEKRAAHSRAHSATSMAASESRGPHPPSSSLSFMSVSPASCAARRASTPPSFDCFSCRTVASARSASATARCEGSACSRICRSAATTPAIAVSTEASSAAASTAAAPAPAGPSRASCWPSGPAAAVVLPPGSPGVRAAFPGSPFGCCALSSRILA
mmetsp:Transcript_71367/g.220345  ORF Transcript_71367/g.220345 Transcript_71367/m.220345 type:complete len:252 (-) Transcript_71367:962-1717(-)